MAYRFDPKFPQHRAARSAPARRLPVLIAALALAAMADAAVAQSTDASAVKAADTPSTSLSAQVGAKVTELKKIDVKPGTGTEAVAGKSVVVHYTGWLYDPAKPDGHGAKFDSSVDRGQPFVFPLGAGRVIKGWDNGVAGMKTGGKRTLVIPPDMAYADRGAGNVIPPNATLVFDVELIEVKG